MNVAPRRCQVVDSFWLKLIALVTMTIDHTAAALTCGSWYLPMRCIGRIALPIYCFLLLEGFFHTGNRRQYLLRLLLLFLISEPVYDRVFHGVWLYGANQNILLTLAIGLGTVWLADGMEQVLARVGGYLTGTRRTVTLWALKLAACFLGMALAELTMADYGYGGIALILAFYFFREKPVRLCVAVLLCLVLLIGPIEIYGLLALIPILLYSGQRGALLQGHGMQYAFYLYYPAHIAVLRFIQLVC